MSDSHVNSKENSFDKTTHIELEILSQPDETTCGPTCLHAVYHYYKDAIDLEQVIHEVHKFEDGGTLAVWLGCHALERGYESVLYTCNVQLFDPTWFSQENVDIYRKLQQQMRFKREKKFLRTSRAFMDYIKLGGRIKFVDLTRELLRKHLSQNLPVLTGLSSTFLYRSAREVQQQMVYNDVRGVPTGHFVILCGYNKETKHVLVADPLASNPFSPTRKYEIHIDRVICAILLGVLTYDANFLIIKPKNGKRN